MKFNSILFGLVALIVFSTSIAFANHPPGEDHFFINDWLVVTGGSQFNEVMVVNDNLHVNNGDFKYERNDGIQTSMRLLNDQQTTFLFEDTDDNREYFVRYSQDGTLFDMGSVTEGGRNDIAINTVTGNVGIGTNNPQKQLDVNGDVTADNYFSKSNSATGVNSFALGGTNNTASGEGSTVGGGINNTASGGTFGSAGATVGGGRDNTASGNRSTVGGGEVNTALVEATVSGGLDNTADGQRSTIGGGSGNTASGAESTIGGGFGNTASGDESTIGGGDTNQALGIGNTVGGGDSNYASEGWSTVGGGFSNLANQDYSTVGGGHNNNAEGDYSTVSGGDGNLADDITSTVGGGYFNWASGADSTIGGGFENTASGDESTVGGGIVNYAVGWKSTVGGGDSNSAEGESSTVGGGEDNLASGLKSTIPGGSENVASGNFAFAAGHNAHAINHGSIVFSDSTATDFLSTADNQFSVKAIGGSRIFSNAGLTTGVLLAPNSNAWGAVSDIRLKENISEYNVLDKLADYRAVEFDWKSGGHDVGVTAQEIESIFPEVVNSGSYDDNIESAGEQGVWSVQYAKLGALALQAIKEQQRQIDALTEIICNDNPNHEICQTE